MDLVAGSVAMSRCAPYAVSVFSGHTLDDVCAMFLRVGWNPDQGATLEQTCAVLVSLGIRSRVSRGAGLPSVGIVFVAGQTCHAVSVRHGRIQEIKEQVPLPVKVWHSKHGARYPRVVGCIEILG